MDKTFTTRVVLAPGGDELGEVVRAKDGGVSGQVVEAVRDHSHHDVQHDEGAEEDEGDKVEIGDRVATALLWVSHVELAVLGVVPLVRVRVARSTGNRGHHDVWPRFTR